MLQKKTIERIASDVKSILKNPLENIYYKHDEENILLGYGLIIGPTDTPYSYGYYLFKFEFPENYPFYPPKVTYLSNDGYTRYNPNFYINGKVCLSILNTWNGDSWTSCQTISSILLTLSTVLCEFPLTNEPGIDKKNNLKNVNNYNLIIKYKNIEYIIIEQMNILLYEMNNNINYKFLNKFREEIIENFLNNKEKIDEVIENNFQNKLKKINETIFQLNVRINKKMLLDNLNKIKLKLIKN